MLFRGQRRDACREPMAKRFTLPFRHSPGLHSAPEGRMKMNRTAGLGTGTSRNGGWECRQAIMFVANRQDGGLVRPWHREASHPLEGARSC